MKINGQYISDGINSAVKYFPNTLQLVFISLAIGLVIGTIFALIRYYHFPLLSKIIALFIVIYQGIPIVVALLIYHLLFMNYLGDILGFFHSKIKVSDVNTIWIGILALSLTSICSVSEVVRGALYSVDRGQEEAGYAVGMTRVQIIRRVILPQLIQVAIAPLTNTIVGLIKASSIVSVVGIIEVTQGALLPSATTYAFFEGYISAAIVYWIFSIIVEIIMGRISKFTGKYRRNPPLA